MAPDAYPRLSDQRTAAGLFWGTGELFTLVVAGIILRQWWLGERRAEAREVREAVMADSSRTTTGPSMHTTLPPGGATGGAGLWGSWSVSMAPSNDGTHEGP